MKRLSAVFLSLALLLGTATPIVAYELAPSARFSSSAISDGTLSVCYGTSTSQWLYVYRANLADYLKRTWGTLGYGNLTFTSNGVCNDDGSNIEIVWNYSWHCNVGQGSITLGQVQTHLWEWDSLTVQMNGACSSAGRWDWSSNWPQGGGGNTTSGGQYSIQQWVAHEVGHTLGINHSSDTRAIMNSGPDGNCHGQGTSQGLDRDDTDGLRDEYDGKGYAWVSGIDNAPNPPTCWD